MSEQLIQTPGVFGETGNFLLERELGKGGMGGVYMGRDKMLDRPVAVKVMLKEYGADEAFVEKFKKEAQAAAKLIHPNIAQIYSYGIADGMPYMAMELVAGGSLEQMMATQKDHSEIQRVLKIGEQVAQALRCASDMGFVHGDVKPENILLDANGNAKLVDFGLAAMQKDTDEIWGTPYYIAPEKVRKEVVDFRADMYNLGGTLYHALTGKPPFDGVDSNAVVQKRFEEIPLKPSEIRPEITPEVDALVMKMLAFDPAERFPSFEALLVEFRFVLSNGLTPAPKAVVKSGKGGKKLVIKGKKKFKVKPPVMPDDAIPEKRAIEDDEEGQGGVLGKVLLAIGGVIALIGIVIGLLVWFKVSTANAEKAEERAMFAKAVVEAKEAVEQTRTQAWKFAEEFDTFTEGAIALAQKPTDELTKALPSADAKKIKIDPTKELLDAIKSTNVVEKVDEKPVVTNVVEKVEAEEKPSVKEKPKKKRPKFREPTEEEKDPMAPEHEDYLEEKRQWEAEQKAKEEAGEDDAEEDDESEDEAGDDEEEKADDNEDEAVDDEWAAKKKAQARKAAKEKVKLPEEPPSEYAVVIKDMNDLWERAYGCKAAGIRVHHQIVLLDKMITEGIEKSDGMGQENAEALAELSRIAKEKLEEIKASDDVTKAKKAMGFIRSKGESIVKRTLNDIRVKKLEKEREDAAKEREEEDRKRLEAIAAEKQEVIDREIKEINAKFDGLAMAGVFRLLDWSSAIRQLNAVKDEFQYAESQIVADTVILKVKMMKMAFDILAQNAKGFEFQRSKLRLCRIEDITDSEVKLLKQDGKTKMKLTWVKFYQEYQGNLSELINKFIEKGRATTKLDGNTLTLRNWAEAMMGAALTMRIICSENPSSLPRGETIAKKAVKEFPVYLKNAQAIFPDISFDGVVTDEDEE